MRAVARASGLKLGALQYHYPTRAGLVCALATSIAGQTASNVEVYCQQAHTDDRGLHALATAPAYLSLASASWRRAVT